MKDVLAPAIRYAREGHPVTELIAYYWALLGAAPVANIPGFTRTVHDRRPRAAQGRDLEEPEPRQHAGDDRRRRPRCVLQGRHRRTHRRLLRGQRRLPVYEDLAAHNGEWVEPVSTNYRGYDVWELPPNGQGIAALQMLNMLEGYDLKSSASAAPSMCTCSSKPRSSRSPTARALRRSGFLQGAGRQTDLQGLRGRARKLISMDHADAFGEPGTPPRSNKATRST